MPDKAPNPYIDELKKDAEMFREAAECYEILSQHGMEFIAPGFTTMKASEMARLYRLREKDLRDLIRELGQQ